MEEQEQQHKLGYEFDPSRIRPLRVLVKGRVASRNTVLATATSPCGALDAERGGAVGVELPGRFVLKVADMYQQNSGREINLLYRLQGSTSHVPRIYGFFPGVYVLCEDAKNGKELWNFSRCNTFVTFVMEYAPMGDLLGLVPELRMETRGEEVGGVQTLVASVVAAQMLEVLMHMHSKLNVIHADLKLDNILVASRDRFYLADFESACFIFEEEDTTTGKRNEARAEDARAARLRSRVIGTAFMTPPELMCPEVVEAPELRSRVLPAADIYALGVAVFEIISCTTFASYLQTAARSGILDRQACENRELLRSVMRSSICPLEKDFVLSRGWLDCVKDDLAQDFIRICTCAQPDRRPTARQLIDHPFVRDYRGEDMC